MKRIQTIQERLESKAKAQAHTEARAIVMQIVGIIGPSHDIKVTNTYGKNDVYDLRTYDLLKALEEDIVKNLKARYQQQFTDELLNAVAVVRELSPIEQAVEDALSPYVEPEPELEEPLS